MDQNNQILKLLTEEFSSFSININDYRKIKLIGKGGYAEVWLGENINTGDQVALKQLYPTLTPKQVRSFAREIRTMSYGNHPFFVKFIGFSSTSCLTLISEYMPNGSLFRFLRSEHRRKRLTGTHRTLIAMGIAHAMNYLHSLGIIHRDLKSMNILLDSKYFPRLCDFGIARFLDPTQVMTTHIGTPHWMAPEILNGNRYGKEVDVYSFAMLMYELMTNLIPWAGLEPSTVIKQVCADNLRPKLPPETPEPIRKLIHLCWSKSPEKRPTFANIYHIFKTGQAAFPDTDQNEIKKLDKKLKKFDLANKPSSYPNRSPTSPQSPLFSSASNIRNSSLFENENKSKNEKKIKNKNKGNQYDSYDSDDDDEYKEESSPRPNIKNQVKGNQQKVQKSSRNKFTAEVVYDEFTETEETNSMFLKQDTDDLEKKDKPIKLNGNTILPIDLDALDDPKDPRFFDEMKKAEKSLSQSQLKEFFTKIGNFFNSKTIDDLTLKKILEYLLPILSSNKIAVAAFAELDLQLKLPLSNRSENDILFLPCLNILIKLFTDNPWMFQNNFNDQMITIIKRSPSKAIILLAHFANASKKLENCWDLLDLMIKQADSFLNDNQNKAKTKSKSKSDLVDNINSMQFSSSRELISILYNLCITNKEYKNYRLHHCLNVFQKGLESEDPETVCLSYNSMSDFFSDSMEFDLSLLVKHLNCEATAKACLSILIRMKHIPRCQPIVSALLHCALKYEEATFCLIRIALKLEGAQMIISKNEEEKRSSKTKSKSKDSYDSEGSNGGRNYNFDWIQTELPSYENTLKIFLSVFYHPELRMELIMNKSTAKLFNTLFESKESSFLTAFSVVIQSISTDEVSSEDIDLLSKRKLFINFINTANEIRDENSVEAIIDVVRHISDVQFVPEFTSVFELIIDTQLSSSKSSSISKITQKAIQMFAAASEWQSASRKMKKLGVDKIVREKFSDDSKLARYTKKLLANIQ